MLYVTTENQKVQIIHHMPFDPEYGLGKTATELETTGFLVEGTVPEYSLPLEDGKQSQLHYTKERGFWFELVNIK